MVVAERMLTVASGGRTISVRVVVEAPVLDRNAWISNYSIGWPEGSFTHRGMGNDSMQALLSAMRLVAINLYASPYHNAGTLMWERPGEGYGFPLPADSRGLALGMDKDL